MSEDARGDVAAGGGRDDASLRRALLHALVVTLRAVHARSASLEPIVTAAPPPAAAAPPAPVAPRPHLAPQDEDVEADETRALVSIALRAGAAGLLSPVVAWPLMQALEASSMRVVDEARWDLTSWFAPSLAFAAIEAGGSAAREVLEDPRALAPPYSGIPRRPGVLLLLRAARFGFTGLAVGFAFAIDVSLTLDGGPIGVVQRAAGFAALGALLGLPGGSLSPGRGALALGLGAAAAPLLWPFLAALPSPLAHLAGWVDWCTASAAASYMWALRRARAFPPLRA